MENTSMKQPNLFGDGDAVMQHANQILSHEECDTFDHKFSNIHSVSNAKA